MRNRKEYLDHRKYRQTNFFRQYAKYHIPWMKELITAYKERGQFPLFPTFITNYYEESQDKEIAILSTLCLDWDKDVLTQIKYIRELMGEHPYDWFKKRGFIVLSIAKNQDNRLQENEGKTYWKIARFFSILYDKCGGKTIRKTFSQTGSIIRFALSLQDDLGFTGMEYKSGVIELVLRASDGFSLGLWPTDPSRIKTPVKSKIKTFLGVWFPDYNTRGWDFEEGVSVFGLERNYDFFYYYLAWEELKKSNKKGCVAYSTRYVSRYKGGYLMGPVFWTGKRGIMPEIKFNDD